MTKARQRSLWRLAQPLAATALVGSALVGCADDETVSTTGAGGSAATGGTTGKAGSGTAGKAGSGGTSAGGTSAGGSSGKGGTSAGGSSGSSGKGGGGQGGGGAAGGTGGGGAGGSAGSAGKGGGAAGGAAGGGAGGSAGNGGSGGMTACATVAGDGTLATKTKLADGGTTFFSPFDAVPSPDGATVYFTALDTATGKGAVYSVPAAGGTVTTIAVGMVAPTGIAVSGDGKTLYVADEGGAEDVASGDITKDAGLFYTVGTAAASTPTVAAKGGRPHSVTVARDAGCKDVVYVGTWTGGVPTISTFAGGAFTMAVATKFEASGIDVAADGTLFWVETVGGPWASIQTAKAGGTGTAVASGLYVGYPAGLALSPDGKNLVLSALAPTDGTDSLVKLDTGGKTLTQQQPATDKASIESAGLHRALAANVFAFVDGLGSTGTGAVYLVKPLGRGHLWRLLKNANCKLRCGRARGDGCRWFRRNGFGLEPP